MPRLSPPNFNRIARLYRPAEYLTFGPFLERCRFFHLPAVSDCRRALILGDGDGRFLVRLLTAAPELRADAVDLSPALLRLLRNRAVRARVDDRLTTLCADARGLSPIGVESGGYDLICTHFFLDCLTDSEVQELLGRVLPNLPAGTRWLVSEFQIPPGSRIQAALARAVIFGLYTGFRLLTGLRVRRIPAWPEHLARAGFVRQRSQSWLGGLLLSEVWQRPEATRPAPGQSHGRMAILADVELKSPAFPNDLPGIDPGPVPGPTPTPEPSPEPAPGPPPEPDPIPYPGPAPTPQPVT